MMGRVGCEVVPAPPRLSMPDRAALRKLKYAKLVERAEDEGVSEDDLAAAEDADDPNEAVIELLLDAGADKTTTTPWGTAAECAERQGHAALAQQLICPEYTG